MANKLVELLIFLLFGLSSLLFWVLRLLPTLIGRVFRSIRTKKLKKVLHTTQDYEEWMRAAIELDREAGALWWRADPRSDVCDSVYLERIVAFLEDFIAEKKIPELMHLTRSVLLRNFSGVNNSWLYAFCLSGTKEIVEHFHDAVDRALDTIYASDAPQKREFFLEAKHCFGRTGLMLSGGASFGMFHLGLVATLLKFDLLPGVLCGSSAGSLIAALIGTHSNEELLSLAEDDFTGLDFSFFSSPPPGPRPSLWQRLRQAFKRGYILDSASLVEFAKVNTKNLTFAEAFKLTKRVLNITVTDNHHQKSRILNYLSAPDVYIWSAAIASCAFPVVYPRARILAKSKASEEAIEGVEWLPDERYFFDGSFGGDIPMRAIATLFNVTNFVVAQVNVHILLFSRRSYYHMHSITYFFKRLIELVLSFIVSEIAHRLRQLNEIHLIPTSLGTYFNIFFQEYVGNVNIYPNFDLWDVIHIFDNPSPAIVRKWTRRGRNRAFFHKKQIEDFTKLEKKLSYCVNQLNLKHRVRPIERRNSIEDLTYPKQSSIHQFS